ncbi:MAG: transposase family protein, partial [Candidatus Thermoplasmatota archaeon]|nr:transposase family protein [Candidatus Thermoplasmatota archaeon]
EEDWEEEKKNRFKKAMKDVYLDEDGGITDERGLVIPSPPERARLVQKYHRILHESKKPLAKRITEAGYSWRGLEVDCGKAVLDCLNCPKSGKSTAACGVPKRHMGEATKINEVVFTDCIGPLLESNGYRYIKVMVDLASGYCRIWGKKGNTGAEDVSGLLDNWVYLLGPMERLVHDGGPENMNRQLWAVCDVLGIDRTVVTAYNHDGNSIVERLNRVIEDSIVTHGWSEEWVSHLKEIEFSLNTRIYSRTGESPIGWILPWRKAGFQTVLADLQTFNVNIPEIKVFTPETGEEVEEPEGPERIEALEMSKKGPIAESGDIVWIRNRSKTWTKMDDRYLGPFVVADKHRN